MSDRDEVRDRMSVREREIKIDFVRERDKVRDTARVSERVKDQDVIKR